MPRTAAKARIRRPNGKPAGMDDVRNSMAKIVAVELEEQNLTQTEAAYLMKDAPSQISLVVTGKLRGFSIERLLRMVNRLGRDVDVVVRQRKGTKAGRTRLIREG